MKTLKPKPKLITIKLEKMQMTSLQMKRIRGGEDTGDNSDNPTIKIKE